MRCIHPHKAQGHPSCPVLSRLVLQCPAVSCVLCSSLPSSCEPRTATVRGLLRLEAEQAWVALAQQLQLQLTVFRLGGGWHRRPQPAKLPVGT